MRAAAGRRAHPSMQAAASLVLAAACAGDAIQYCTGQFDLIDCSTVCSIFCCAAGMTVQPALTYTTDRVTAVISNDTGMGNPAFRMQLMRAQQAALGGTAAQYIQNLQSSSPAAAASPAVASSGQGLPPLFAAAGGAAAPAGSSDPSAAAAGIDAQQSAARQTTAQAAADTLQQPPSEQLQQQQQDVAAAADPTASLQQLQAQQLGGPELQSTLDVQQTASEAPAGSEHTPDAVDGAAHTSMDLDS